MPETPFPKDTAKAMGPLVDALMKELGLGSRVTEEEIIAAWHEIVGEFLSNHSTPSRLFEGILYVRVLQASMKFELETTWTREPTPLTRLRHEVMDTPNSSQSSE